jgi:hypothetical protein
MQKLTNVLFATLATIAIGGTPISAYAEVQPAMAGHGWPNHFDTCFTSSFALMRNACSGTVGSTRLLIVPTATDAGTYHPVARATGNGSNGATDCQGIAVNSAGNGVSFTQIVATSASSAVQQLSLGTVVVPSGGSLHFECHLAQGGGQLINIER